MTTKANSNLAKHLRRGFFRKLLSTKEANSEYCQASKMKPFAIIAKSWNLINIYEKTSTLYVWQGSEHASELASKCKLSKDASFLN